VNWGRLISLILTVGSIIIEAVSRAKAQPKEEIVPADLNHMRCDDSVADLSVSPEYNDPQHGGPDDDTRPAIRLNTASEKK